MTRDEVKQLVRIVVNTYPNFKADNIKETIDSWYFFLEDENAHEIAAALKTFVKTNGNAFAPSVSQLIELANKMKEGQELLSSEAWALVRPAIADSYYNAEKYFNEFPPEIQKAIGSSQVLKNWGDTDSKTVDSVIASNFKRNYEAVMNRKKDVHITNKNALYLEQITGKALLGKGME